MIRLIQDFFLSDLLIFIVLFIAIIALTRWALGRLREYAGYGLGWMIGIFFVLVYSSLVGQADIDSTQVTEAGTATLSIFQVLASTVVGLIFGVGSMVLLQAGNGAVQQSLKIAMFVALNIILLFLMFVETSQTRRMIGIFALAFAIASMFTLVILPRNSRLQRFSGVQSQAARPRPDLDFPEPPANPPPGGIPPQDQSASGTGSGRSRLDEIRERMNRR